ncbi:GcrA family cell cycle regulator [Faecalispora anaeroviscerum]|uniref:GcrA family cell cycle regulator n=1 Tax=Faecalispora anaeroviscerum TaxID=2991836 RepID=UPI0024BB439A|nr:GcrA family cell cycle regulator [Faecalispora anaeroviscerum]
MKWSEEKVSQLKELAFAGVPNPQIAKQLGVGVSDIYAKRSQLGITREKVQAVKDAAAPPEPEAISSKEIDEDRAAHNREADEKRNLLQLLEPVIRKADPSVRSVVLINQGRLVQIDYANEFRRYVDIQGDSLLAIIYDVARVAMK